MDSSTGRATWECADEPVIVRDLVDGDSGEV
jgi:hypothetical protein